MRIAVAQLAVSEDVNANYERTLEVIREADGNGAELQRTSNYMKLRRGDVFEI